MLEFVAIRRKDTGEWTLPGVKNISLKVYISVR